MYYLRRRTRSSYSGKETSLETGPGSSNVSAAVLQFSIFLDFTILRLELDQFMSNSILTLYDKHDCSVLFSDMNTTSLSKGSTEDQLSSLPSWKFKDVGSILEQGIPAQNHEMPECCICLAKYREKEEIRQFPCTHIFHLNCVDQWLKIISCCCPLCKQGIEK